MIAAMPQFVSALLTSAFLPVNFLNSPKSSFSVLVHLERHQQRADGEEQRAHHRHQPHQ
jgi:hypothetical protein